MLKHFGLLKESYYQKIYKVNKSLSCNKLETQYKNHIYYLDVAKIIVVFLVVFCHSYGHKTDFSTYIYSFHMPFFFVVGGIFHKYNNNVQLKKYFKHLIVPAFFYVFLAVLVKFVLNIIGGTDWYLSLKIDIYSIIASTWKSKGLPNVECWFLFAYFWSKVLFDIIKKINNWYLSLFIIGTSIIIIYYLRLPLFIGQGIMGLPFYLFGYYMSSYYKEHLNHSFKMIIIPLLILWLFLVKINGRVSMYGINFGGFYDGLNVIVFYTTALLGTHIIFILSSLYNKYHIFIYEINKSLIGILGGQRIWIIILTFLFYYSNNGHIIESLLGSLLIIILCHYGYILQKNYIPWTIGNR